MSATRKRGKNDASAASEIEGITVAFPRRKSQ